MAHDPLARATRTTRTSLLTFCAIFLSLYLFRLEEENFEVLSVPVPDNFLPVGLAIAIIILSITFALYAYDDVRSRDTLARNKAELESIDVRIVEVDELIQEDDRDILEAYSAYHMDTEKRTYMRARDTAHLENTKYSASKHLAERRDLGARKLNLKAAIAAPDSSALSSARFWIVDIGFPIMAVALCAMAWFDSLAWLRDLLGIAPEGI